MPPDHTHVQQRALVLGRHSYGEGHLYVSLLTAQKGIIRVSARQALRPKRGLAAAMEIATLSDCQLFYYRGRWQLDQATIVYPFSALREHILAFTQANILFELLQALFVHGSESCLSSEVSKDVYELLLRACYALEQRPQVEASNLSLALAMARLMSLAQCGLNFGEDTKEPSSEQYWSFEAHRFYAEPSSEGKPLRACQPALLKALQWAEQAPLDKVFAVEHSAALGGDCLDFMLAYQASITEQILPSSKLLADLESFSRAWTETWPGRKAF